MTEVECLLIELLLAALELLVVILKTLYDINKKDDHH